jgi:hypothetical protein
VYSRTEELNAIVARYLTDGLDHGERCVYILGDRSLIEVVDALDRAGIDVPRRAAEGSFQMLRAQQVYLESGTFDARSTIARVQDAVERARADGFAALRAVGEMGWALAGTPLSSLVDYERELDRSLRHLFAGETLSGLCAYDAHRFAPSSIRALTLAHRVAIRPFDRASASMLDGGRSRVMRGDAWTDHTSTVHRDMA